MLRRLIKNKDNWNNGDNDGNRLMVMESRKNDDGGGDSGPKCRVGRI